MKTRSHKLRSVLAFCVLAAFAAACSKDKDVDRPTELVDIASKLDVSKVWTSSLGGKAKVLRLALQPAVSEGVVYAASHKGEVKAYAMNTGAVQWSVNTKLALSGGPSAANGVVVIGTTDGNVIALDAKTGAKRWTKPVSSEVLAAPLIADDFTVVRTVDGRLHALALSDGASRWNVDQPVPRLTLRGTAPPVLAGANILAGFDSGKVVAVDAKNGDIVWDSQVNVPHGRTELERLSDIDSPVRVSGDNVFVVGFQGRVAMLALDSGQIWWARDASSYRGFAMDEDNLYMTDADGTVTAIHKKDGGPVWEQAALKFRGLTAPAIDGNALVVGDFQGYLHWLDLKTGEIIARTKTDGDRITNAPVSANGEVLVQTDAGKLLAFRSKPKA
jgi:outer membrane protein assembly factor BamB